MRKPAPKKQKGRATGPRRFDGVLRDVDGIAAILGSTPKQVRSQIARGLLPHRRLGGRIVFLPDEITEFLRKLPGVSADQALANVGARNGGGAGAGSSPPLRVAAGKVGARSRALAARTAAARRAR